jgi:hypothetical protein
VSSGSISNATSELRESWRSSAAAVTRFKKCRHFLSHCLDGNQRLYPEERLQPAVNVAFLRIGGGILSQVRSEGLAGDPSRMRIHAAGISLQRAGFVAPAPCQNG